MMLVTLSSPPPNNGQRKICDMFKIKPSTQKLLNDLQDPAKWENSLFCIRHKEQSFEIWVNSLFIFTHIWKQPEVKFNLREKWLVHKLAKKIKNQFLKGDIKPPCAYFK